MADKIARLCIVDQTLKDFHGHHFEYDAAIAEAAQKAGLNSVIFANKKYKKVGAEATEVVPWFQTTWYDSMADSKHARTFWSDTLDFIARRELTDSDILLIHTVSLAEYREIVDYYHDLLWCDVAKLPSVFVILRRDPDEYGDGELAALRAKLRRVYQIPDLGDRLVICTDTELLRQGWCETLGQPVLTLPIPFRHQLVDRFAHDRRADASLQVVYLGDARNEKGYQHFPGMVQELWPRYIQPGKVEVTLQSNYNLPGGEGGIPQARLRLQRYPHGVTLLSETMDPESYYAVLAKADIIVLPYDPQAYARRSSGVLNEAIAAGKVAVVPQESWLASQLAPERGIVYKHPGGLADGVIAAIERFPELSRGAADYQARYRSEQNPDRFVQSMLQHLRKPKRQPSAAALYVMDGDSVVNRTGAGSVARQQMQALGELGFRIHAVFQRIHVDEDHNIHAMRAWMEAIREEVRDLRLASVWGVGHTPFYGHEGMMAEREILRSRNLRLDADCNYRAAFAVPAGLVETLRDDPPRVAVVNYVQSVPFARGLAGPKTPILCETHDIQAFQFALRNPQGYQQSDLELELKLLGEAGHVVSLNQLETDFLRERLGRDRVSYIPQPIGGGPARLSTLAGARDPADVVRACGPSHPAFDPRQRLQEPNIATYFRQARSIDLLYVSSWHGPNIEGLQQFLHHVFFARLVESGVTLAVAGTICGALGHLEGPNVLLAHRVRDLEPLYAAAKVVILPILDGAGSAIKTIEAMARARPVVATSFAMRGVDRSSEPFPVYDDWSDFGDRVLELLGSEEKRLAAAQASFRLSLVNGNDGAYAQRLGQALGAILSAAGDAPAPQARKPAAPQPPERLVEWSEAVGRFNALSADYLTLGYVAPSQLAAYRTAPLERGVGEDLFSAAFEKLEDEAGPRLEAGRRESFGRLMQLIEGVDIADWDAEDVSQDLDTNQVFAPAGAAAKIYAYDRRGDSQVLWRSAGLQPGRNARVNGLIAVTLPQAPPCAAIEQLYDLVAAPRAGLSPCIAVEGFYDQEVAAGPRRRWTGPGPASTFLITISRRHDVELGLRVHDVLDGAVYENACLEVDGQPLPTLKWSRNGKRMLVALAPRARGALFDRMSITLHAPRTLSPSSVYPDNVDTRLLGLGLGELEARSQITGAPALDHSFLAQTFKAMAERSAADVVAAGYRDLLKRAPDPGGCAHYVAELSERRMTAHEFFRDLIHSAEFKTNFPRLRAAVLDRYLDEA